MDEDRVLEVLGKNHAKTVLLATASPRSAPELSEEYDIPIATCYRRLKELREVGLVEEHLVVGESNRSGTEYERAVDEITVRFREDEMWLTLDAPERASSTIDAIWSLVRGGPSTEVDAPTDSPTQTAKKP